MDIIFTTREISILKELIKGKSYKEISKTLYISVATVKFYMGQIAEKIGKRGKINILLFIIEHKNLLEIIKNNQINNW